MQNLEKLIVRVEFIRVNYKMETAIRQRWFRLGILNLVLVAIFGALMRYKTAYSFPYFNQSFLLHAHSHFAFAGWISHILYTGLIILISNYLDKSLLRKYKALIILNLIAAYGMLIAFSVQGYKAVSITFSTLSIFVSFFFVVFFIKDSKYIPKGTTFKPWTIVGLLVNVISAVGPFSLAYLMASKNMNRDLTNSSIYFYLHFQYDGWFFFGSMALLVAMLPKATPNLNKYLTVFALAIVPTYILSILWIDLPQWLLTLAALAAFAQLIAWVLMLSKIRNTLKLHKQTMKSSEINIFFYVAALALTLKFLLQVLSANPGTGALVFSCRPIIIAYLHLILLGAFSMYLIAYGFYHNYYKTNSLAKIAFIYFFIGFFLNEILLVAQSSTWITLLPIPHINEFLFVAAFMLLLGAGLLLVSQLKRENNRNANAHAGIFKS